jgi:hypothetical protein
MVQAVALSPPGRAAPSRGDTPAPGLVGDILGAFRRGEEGLALQERDVSLVHCMGHHSDPPNVQCASMARPLGQGPRAVTHVPFGGLRRTYVDTRKDVP